MKPQKNEHQLKFGAWLKAKRDQFDMTSAEAAKQAEIDATTWRALEAPGMPWHAPSLKTIRGIAAAFGVPVDEVAGRAGVALPVIDDYPRAVVSPGAPPGMLEMMGRLLEQLAEAQRQNAELLRRLADGDGAGPAPAPRRRGRQATSG